MFDYILLVLILFLINNSQDKPDNFDYRMVYTVDSVEFIEKDDHVYKVKIECTVPNPCYQFSHLDLAQKKDSLIVSVFVKKDKNINCIQILGKLNHIVEIDVLSGLDRIIFKGKSNSKKIIIKKRTDE